MGTKPDNIFVRPEPEYGTTESKPKKGTVVKKLVNIRKEPDAKSEAIKALSKGVAVDILSDSGDYYRIEYDHIKGYVRKDLINEVN